MTLIDRLKTAPRHDGIVATVAVITGVCGVLAVIPAPPALRVLPILVFMLGGAGSAVMCWIDLPAAVTTAAVLGISIASMMALAVAMAWLEFWHPVWSCLILALIVTASGTLRLQAIRRPSAAGRPW